MYRGFCDLGYSCDETIEETSAIVYTIGIAIARFESGANVFVAQVTASVEIGKSPR
jgi:hypothetical protein